MKDDIAKSILKLIKEENIVEALAQVHSEFLDIELNQAKKVIQKKFEKQITIFCDKTQEKVASKNNDISSFEKQYKEIKG